MVMEEPGFDSFTQETSKYKDALNQIFRLNDILISCHRYATTGEFLKWNWSLDRVWVELAGELSKDCDEEKEKKEKDTKVYLSLANSLKTNSKKEIYDSLNDKEIFLRRLIEKLGKGSSKKNKEEDEIE